MKVLLVAESFPPAQGGVEFALEKLVEGFIAAGHEVRVITSSWQRHAPTTESRGRLTISRFASSPIFKRLWFQIRALIPAIRWARWADVVQGSTFAGGPPAFLGGWLTGKKKALLAHEVLGKRWFRLEPSWIRSLFYLVTERLIVLLPFDRYIAPSQYTKDSLLSLGIPADKVTVIHHGESRLEIPNTTPQQIRSGLGYNENDFVILSYGRTGVTKGFEFLAESMAATLKQVPEARFLLVLAQYDRRISKRIRKAASSLPAGVCKLLEPVSRSELASFVAIADCVVIPSLSEGFGFSAVEACAAGRVVITTSAGSLPETVFGRCVFVAPGSADAITEGCVKAYNGELSFVANKTFSWEKCVEGYLRVYDEIAGKGERVSGR